MKKFDLDDILSFILFGSIFLGISIIVIGGAFWLLFNMFTFSSFVEEKDCVSFYKENGYILDSCNMYEEKLNSLELGE